MLHIDISKRRGDFTLKLALTAPSGVVALFGRSGCGKSTAVNLIAGLLKPDKGRICSDSTVLFDAQAGINVAAERRQIGYVFQDARLFPHYSVRGNLRYGLRRALLGPVPIDFETVVELLALQTLLDRQPRQLSGGERQRVAIGRALLSQPRLLLLDEPLASLDMARREEVLPYLERLRDHLSIPMVYVSHQYDEVLRLATYVVLMDRGQVLAQGTVPEISTRPELRALVGPDAIGAVIEGVVTAIDPSGLAQVSIGNGDVHVDSLGLTLGQRVRLQLLARDLILATEIPRGLSVRSRLQGVVASIAPDDLGAALVTVNIGSALLTIRVTASAAAELALRPGLPIWVLIKSVTLRGHVFSAPALKGIDAATDQ
jgi:molybdate transport system ATP-binding protein